jgi:hypothetical protein
MGVLRGVSWRGVCVALLLLPGPSPTAGRVSNYTRAIDGDVAGARVHHTHAPAEPAGGASEEDATPHPHTSAGDRAGGDVRSRTRRPVGLVPAVVAVPLVPASDPTSAEPLAGVLRAVQRRALDVEEGRDEDHEAHARNQENGHGRDDQTHTAAATSKTDGDGDASQAHHEGHAETTEGAAAAAAAAATTGAAATDSAAAQETTANTTAADPGLVDPAEVE